ncbi:MAG: S-ribosylhomocysteine lyase [Bacteroidaceae bacterium]|nr:S-ribosylhomocysteine lyase [Bacteroidaceae bacterium]
MKTIASFTIDHIKLQRGIFLSRQDVVGNTVVSTFDIRMKLPNREPALHPNAIHTIEHLAATFLRNHPQWQDKIIYWGPMGCLTGNYLIVKNDYTSHDILPLMIETFKFIASFEGDIPGSTAQECGNYLLQDLPTAKWEAQKFLNETLLNIKEENLNYPQN